MKTYRYLQKITYHDYVYLLDLSPSMAQKTIRLDRVVLGKRNLRAYDLFDLGYLTKKVIRDFNHYR